MIRRGSRRRWLRRGLLALVAFAGLAVLAVAALRFVDPPFTPRSVFRRVAALAGSRKLPARAPRVDIAKLPRHLVRALLVAEDARFHQHSGFDWEEIRKLAEAEEVDRGASTITMQVARNVFLWTGRTLRAPRKAGEIAITPLLELFLAKHRILALYFDWCTFAPGTIGIGEAARERFGVAPEDLTPSQSLDLVACLPNPARYCGEKPSRRHAARMAWIRSRMGDPGAVAPAE